ncbi:alkylhydroperoxidase [Sedimentitalea sp. CY04]|uniref:Alkylhydroperoxidase n=1 Tax=Parasedimentitalea denitrificans TaxID=2211118 RepID=A0ABX0W5T8_9RHOB|nr:carboxymuconolactone decarboxylase family protein [Sedimentitalea sp. CY04]NIZ61016.1 alkylhydroperoxidase [Sedimentitalea sp. CY04]
MTQRLDLFTTAPDLMKPMLAMEETIKSSGLEHSLIELVKLRTSQINGCAFCIHMHTHDARANGESEDRMHLLNAWRESSLYTDRERAALAWTESLTRIERTAAPQSDYDAVATHFSPREQVALTLAITTINAWNRLAIGFAIPHPVAQEANAA